MGVVVEDIRFKNEFKATSTDYLLGNIGDKILVEIDFRAEEVFVTGAEEDINRILLAPQPFRVNVPDSTDVIYCEDIDALTNFKVGDKVGLSITATVYTIYEKLGDQAFRVYVSAIGDTNFFVANGKYDTELLVNEYIYLTTPLTSIIYRYNFNENRSAGTFNSLIDNNVNRMNSSLAVDTVGVSVPMTFAAPNTNNIGNATVVRRAGDTTSQKFTISHYTYITPFFLAENLNDFRNSIAPNELRAESSLKFVTSIDVGRNDNDPNFIETVDFFVDDGNVGWFGENFNGNATNYSIGEVTYKRADTSVITSVELTANEQTVEIVVRNTVDSPFDATTPFTLNFSIMPDDVDDYRNNGKTIIENFYFDRGVGGAGGVLSDGFNLGLDTQIIKNVSAVVNPSNPTTEILITGTLQLSAEALAEFSSRGGLEYFFWVSTQDGALDTEEADKVSLIADIDTFYIDLTDDGMLSFDDKFLRHYESDIETEGTSTPIVRTEDDVVVRSRISIDRLGREDDEILISSIGSEIVAMKSDGSEFTLEQFSQSLNGTQVIGDSQFIDVSSDRAFQMPDVEFRKTISVKRRIDLDTTDLRYYDLVYPFLMRWEYWKALSGTNGDAFDVAEGEDKFNGQNQEWQRYDTLTDWDIYYRTTVNLTKNGNFLSYQNDTLLETYDYLEDTDWTTETIVALNADTLAPQGDLLINPTRIKISKTYVGTTPPSIDDVEWVCRIEINEQGGVNDIRFLSSVYDWTENSWLSSVDASNKVLKTVDGSVYSAEFLVDSSSLPDSLEFKISGRIYNEAALIPIPPDAKLLEDGSVKLMEDGSIKIIE